MTVSDNPSTFSEQQGVSLVDVLGILVTFRWLVIGAPIAAVVIAIAVLLVLRPRWEATAVIQVGQIWQGSSASGPVLVESPARSVERMRFRPFQTAVLAKLGIPQNETDPSYALFTHSVSARVISGTDLIEIKVRAFSREQATSWAEATIQQLKVSHDRLFDPVILRVKQQLEHVKRQIDIVEAGRQELLRTSELKPQVDPGARFSENLLLANLLLQNEQELADLRLRSLTLEEQLNPAKTYPTSLLDSVYVPAKPGYPRKGLVLVAAAVLGLMLGIGIALTVNALWKRRGRL